MLAFVPPQALVTGCQFPVFNQTQVLYFSRLKNIEMLIVTVGTVEGTVLKEGAEW